MMMIDDGQSDQTGYVHQAPSFSKFGIGPSSSLNLLPSWSSHSSHWCHSLSSLCTALLVTWHDPKSLPHSRRCNGHYRRISYFIPRILDFPSFDQHIVHRPFLPRPDEHCLSQFRLLLDDDPNSPLPATQTRTRLLSAQTSCPYSSAIPTSAYFNTDSGYVHGSCSHSTPKSYRSPHRVILLAPSRPLIDASITVAIPIYAGFRPTTTLESLSPSTRRLRFTFKSVYKRTE